MELKVHFILVQMFCKNFSHVPSGSIPYTVLSSGNGTLLWHYRKKLPFPWSCAPLHCNWWAESTECCFQRTHRVAADFPNRRRALVTDGRNAQWLEFFTPTSALTRTAVILSDIPRFQKENILAWHKKSILKYRLYCLLVNNAKKDILWAIYTIWP